MLNEQGISQHDYDIVSPYTSKKGVGFGAWAGFVGAVALTGIMLVTPIALGLPTGAFLYAFGSNLLPGSTSDQTITSVAGFSLVLLQGIIVGVIFGVITSRSDRLHPSRKGKGVGMGIIAGLIAFLVIYVPFMVFVFPTWLSTAITTLPETKLGMFGVPNYILPSPPMVQNNYLPIVLGMGVISHIVYGAIMGGIVTLCYSVFHFARNRGIQYATQQQSSSYSSAGAA